MARFCRREKRQRYSWIETCLIRRTLLPPCPCFSLDFYGQHLPSYRRRDRLLRLRRWGGEDTDPEEAHDHGMKGPGGGTHPDNLDPYPVCDHTLVYHEGSLDCLCGRCATGVGPRCDPSPCSSTYLARHHSASAPRPRERHRANLWACLCGCRLYHGREGGVIDWEEGNARMNVCWMCLQTPWLAMCENTSAFG